MTRQQGFSLVEFLVIVTVLAAIGIFAVPRYLEFRAKAIQSDARINLVNLDKLQHDFRFRNDRFAADLKQLGFVAAEQSRYTYRILSADAENYLAEAEARPKAIADCAGRDVWTINQDKQILNPVDGAKSCGKLPKVKK